MHTAFRLTYLSAIVFIAVAQASCSYFAHATTNNGTIKAQSIVICDSKGRSRIEMGVDDNDNAAISLYSLESGECSQIMMDNKGNTSLSLRGNDVTLYLGSVNPDEQVTISTSKGKGSYLVMNNLKTIGQIQLFQKGNTSNMSLKSNSGPDIFINCDDKSSYLSLYSIQSGALSYARLGLNRSQAYLNISKLSHETSIIADDTKSKINSN